MFNSEPHNYISWRWKTCISNGNKLVKFRKRGQQSPKGPRRQKRHNFSFLRTVTCNSVRADVVEILPVQWTYEVLWAINQNAQLMSPYNSNAPKPNFTKHGCEGSLDTVAISFVLVFHEFLLVSAQRPSEGGGLGIFAQKCTFWAPACF